METYPNGENINMIIQNMYIGQRWIKECENDLRRVSLPEHMRHSFLHTDINGILSDWKLAIGKHNALLWFGSRWYNEYEQLFIALAPYVEYKTPEMKYGDTGTITIEPSDSHILPWMYSFSTQRIFKRQGRIAWGTSMPLADEKLIQNKLSALRGEMTGKIKWE